MANNASTGALPPTGPGPFPVTVPIEPGTNSLWDRLSTWASENKGVVYTIAGLTLVVGAGGVIYYSSSDKSADAGAASTSNKRKKNRERKRAKDRAEKESAAKDEAPAAGMCWHGTGCRSIR